MKFNVLDLVKKANSTSWRGYVVLERSESGGSIRILDTDDYIKTLQDPSFWMYKGRWEDTVDYELASQADINEWIGYIQSHIARMNSEIDFLTKTKARSLT